MPTIDNIEEMDIVERDGETYLEIIVDEGEFHGAPVSRAFYIPWDLAKQVASFVRREPLRRRFRDD